MYVIFGWILDRLFGDPTWLPHPVVFFGKIISKMERRYNNGKSALFKGAVVAIVLILATFFSCSAILHIVSGYSLFAAEVLCTIALFFALSGKTLAKEVEMVFVEVDASLERGRSQVARIVGRDTGSLSAQQVRTAALETLAENLNDGVIAPLFWCALLGVPGVFAYKMVNTLDSMIGYRNERYIEFGRFAARIDDIANFIPARITALLMISVVPIAGWMIRLRFVLRYGKRHLSPNSGYPEAALASILDCRFGGPHNYFGVEVYKPYIGANHKDFKMEDMYRAINVNLYSEVIMVLLVSIVINFI